jgi:predicted MFS family arabinose efflux permease
LLITAFAVGMIVAAPAMAIATLRLPWRATLVGALVVFAAGHVLAAVSSDFAVVLAARVLTALVTGASGPSPRWWPPPPQVPHLRPAPWA